VQLARETGRFGSDLQQFHKRKPGFYFLPASSIVEAKNPDYKKN
jgi:hypothetical protein